MQGKPEHGLAPVARMYVVPRGPREPLEAPFRVEGPVWWDVWSEGEASPALRGVSQAAAGDLGTEKEAAARGAQRAGGGTAREMQTRVEAGAGGCRTEQQTFIPNAEEGRG